MDILAKQLIDSNSTDFTMDTRTPPRIKLHQKNAKKPTQRPDEPSHMGVAVPVDVDTLMEVTTAKTEKTTDSGLSTWILLSGNSPSTKPSRKPSLKTTTTRFVEKTTTKPTTVKEMVKPSTTVKATTIKATTIKATTLKATTSKATTLKATTLKAIVTTTKPTTKPPTTTTLTSLEPKVPTKMMTKIKASVFSSALSNRTTPQMSSTTVSTTARTTVAPKNATEAAEEATLKPEAKIDEVDLPESKVTTKRPTKRPVTNKRKKNKNRRRKPEANTKNVTKLGQKEKPIGTQIYNYLSREVMPTVGVGLVGLVVTAGLASYFLFPFTGLRRNFEGAIDRRDENFYDTYMDGELEQDVIGKMIEGGFEYNAFANSVYQPYDRFGGYERIVAERQKETGYTVDDRKFEQKQFVVGSVPDSFVPVTPAAVPEHGPRRLRIRRDVAKEEDNEITVHRTKYTKYKETLKQKADAINESLTKNGSLETTILPENSTASTPTNSTEVQKEPNNFFTFFRNLFEMKVRIGLDFLVNTTESVSKYLRGVQTRVEHVIQANHDRHKKH